MSGTVIFTCCAARGESIVKTLCFVPLQRLLQRRFGYMNNTATGLPAYQVVAFYKYVPIEEAEVFAIRHLIVPRLC